MDFQLALETHLGAIKGRILKDLSKSIPQDGDIAYILPNGEVIGSAAELREYFTEWFSEDQWKINHKILFTETSQEMAYAVVEAEYSDVDEDGPYELTYLSTLIFRLIESKWIMVSCQNTEIDEED